MRNGRDRYKTVSVIKSFEYIHKMIHSFNIRFRRLSSTKGAAYNIEILFRGIDRNTKTNFVTTFLTMPIKSKKHHFTSFPPPFYHGRGGEATEERRGGPLQCKSCGFQNSEQANFCGKCGKKLREVCDCWIKKSPTTAGRISAPVIGSLR